SPRDTPIGGWGVAASATLNEQRRQASHAHGGGTGCAGSTRASARRTAGGPAGLVVSCARASWRAAVAALVRSGASEPPTVRCPRANPLGGWGVEASPALNEQRRPASHAR